MSDRHLCTAPKGVRHLSWAMLQGVPWSMPSVSRGWSSTARRWTTWLSHSWPGMHWTVAGLWSWMASASMTTTGRSVSMNRLIPAPISFRWRPAARFMCATRTGNWLKSNSTADSSLKWRRRIGNWSSRTLKRTKDCSLSPLTGC